MLPTLLAAVLLAAPVAEDAWLPLSVRASFSALVATDGSPTLGVDLATLAIFGRPGTGPLPWTHQGVIYGAGVRASFAGGPWTACDWCLSRQTFGPVGRLGYVVSDRLEGPTVPDFAFWLEASPLLVRESIPDAPLMPGGGRLGFATRVEVGVTSAAWTLAILSLVGLVAEEGSTEVGAITLPLFALAFINQLSLTWEWSGAAVSGSTHRFGGTIGGSF